MLICVCILTYCLTHIHTHTLKMYSALPGDVSKDGRGKQVDDEDVTAYSKELVYVYMSMHMHMYVWMCACIYLHISFEYIQELLHLVYTMHVN